MPAYDLVFFDCDSTLSSIEGIDELASRAGVDVSELTNAAMDGYLPMEDVYRKRLEMINPAPKDFEWLSELYILTAIKDAKSVITKLHACKVDVHIISGGLLPSIVAFAHYLGIAPSRVHAVPYDCDNPEPSYAHPLANNGGKPAVAESVYSSAMVFPILRLAALSASSSASAESSSEMPLNLLQHNILRVHY